MVQAKILVDSICNGNRITTFLVTMQRYLLAEYNTHAMLVRNAASSRAIPVNKRINQVRDNPAGPSWWGANMAGMQSAESLSVGEEASARLAWHEASQDACRHAQLLSLHGAHKQFANRVIEPFAWCSNLTTGTEWANFFNLRCSPDAAPEFDLLAGLMLRVYHDSEPAELEPGQYHAPFGDKLVGLDTLNGFEEYTREEIPLLVSAARCARLSYETHEGIPDVYKDLQLAKRLLDAGHMSPFGHIAQAVDIDEVWDEIWNSGSEADAIRSLLGHENARMDGEGNIWWGQFRNWRQYRKTLPGENRGTMDASALLREWEARWNERVPDGSWDSEKAQEALDRR